MSHPDDPSADYVRDVDISPPGPAAPATPSVRLWRFGFFFGDDHSLYLVQLPAGVVTLTPAQCRESIAGRGPVPRLHITIFDNLHSLNELRWRLNAVMQRLWYDADRERVKLHITITDWRTVLPRSPFEEEF